MPQSVTDLRGSLSRLLSAPVVRGAVGTLAVLLAAGVLASLASDGSTRTGVLAVGAAVLAALMGATMATGRRIDVALFALVAATAPWNAVRVSPTVTLADALLVATAAVSFAYGGRRRAPSSALVVTVLGVALILLGSFIASLAGGTEAVGPLVKYAAASIGVLLLVALIDPNHQHLRLWMSSFSIGAALSVAYSLATPGAQVVGRELGLTLHPNHLGLTSALGALLAVTVALRSPPSLWSSSAGGVLVLVNLAGALASGSRAALVGLVAGAVVLAVLLGRRHPGRLVLMGTGVVLAVTAILPFLSPTNALARLLRQGAGLESAVAADELRRSAIERSLEGIASSPIVGGGFPELLAAHNIYVQAVVAGGFLGLVGIAVVVVAAGRHALALMRSADRTAWLLTAVLAAYLACGLLQNILFDRYVWVVLAMVVAYRIADLPSRARLG